MMGGGRALMPFCLSVVMSMSIRRVLMLQYAHHMTEFPYSLSRLSEMVFELIAHRGWSDCRPENTQAAFDAAVKGGWTNIETDVQLSSDLVPLVLLLYRSHPSTHVRPRRPSSFG